VRPVPSKLPSKKRAKHKKARAKVSPKTPGGDTLENQAIPPLPLTPPLLLEPAPPAQRRLLEEHKRFIVQRLACFRSPTEVAEDVKEEFGIDVIRQTVRGYNPEQVQVAKKWKAIFDATRAAFLKATASSAIAHQAYRVSELTWWYRYAKSKKNPILARELLEQAAREMGGAFTNRREGVDLNVDLGSLTDEQLERVAAGEDLRKVLGAKR